MSEYDKLMRLAGIPESEYTLPAEDLVTGETEYPRIPRNAIVAASDFDFDSEVETLANSNDASTTEKGEDVLRLVSKLKIVIDAAKTELTAADKASIKTALAALI